MKISQKLNGDVMVLHLSGKIMGGPDHEKFQNEIKTLISDGHVDILLNMSKVNWVNSTGLGILVSAFHTLKKNGGQLKICEVSDRIDNILNVTQLKLVFETFDSCDEALASYLTPAENKAHLDYLESVGVISTVRRDAIKAKIDAKAAGVNGWNTL